MFIILLLSFATAHAVQEYMLVPVTLPETDAIDRTCVHSTSYATPEPPKDTRPHMQVTVQEGSTWNHHTQQVTQQATTYHLAQQGAQAHQQFKTIQHECELLQEQAICAVRNYARQEAQLEEASCRWKQTAPQRVEAYLQTKQNSQLSIRKYTLSEQAKQACKHAGIRINEFDGLLGNFLQHTLMQEIIDGLNTGATYAPPARHGFQRSMYIDTLHLFDNAHTLNDMGLCVDAADLIDVGTRIVDYLAAIARGFTDGAVASIHNTVASTMELVCHPIEAIQNLGKIAITLARITRDHWPPRLPDEYCTAEEYGLYLKQCEQTAQRWQAAAERVRIYWNSSSYCDVAYQASYVLAHVVTNVLVAQQCTKLIANISRSVQPYITSLSKRARKAQISAVAPGYILLEFEATRKIMEYAATQGFTSAYVAQALNNYMKEEAIEGCLASLNTAIGKYHHLPGAQTLINDVFKYASVPALSRARGTSYELICALELEKRGHTILSFGQKIKDYTPDIITTTHVIECKNRNWGLFIDPKTAEASTKKFIRQFRAWDKRCSKHS